MTHAQEAELKRLASIVKMHGDGQSFTPLESVASLSRIVAAGDVRDDDYSLGGSVEELEERMADVLGKERAVFLPTGTLANHLALRVQARGRTRVIVQQDSHTCNDAGDGAALLSQLNLVPLAADSAEFTLDEVRATVARADSGKATTGVGVISIESPMRRRHGERFRQAGLIEICDWARANGIATHLDGARLFMSAGYTDLSPAALAAPFDTVYVSLWKYLNAPSGAILAGPSALLDDLYNLRRTYGGSLPSAWPFAVQALHTLDGFGDRFRAGVERSEELFRALEPEPRLRVERVNNGTNVFHLHVDADDLEGYRARLRPRGIELPPPSATFRGFTAKVNETYSRAPVEQIAHALIDAVP